ncbi:hypothetical protein OS493_008162 [Desmophyllum pertusum]|uniref:Uncharacterized protein n=1 Tax=Desmophyllum pertusum TaxID=174260 RepID=A0A9X0DA35_9CNID|nr:hypothetical protein OS493_008162 [Desmophyllum pertusum]
MSAAVKQIVTRQEEFSGDTSSRSTRLNFKTRRSDISPLQNLVNHLGHLVTGPVSIADVTKKELQCRFAERESSVKSGECRKTLDTLDLNIWEDICALIPF